MAEGFIEKLAAAVRTNGSRLCVGLDPDFKRTPVEQLLSLNREVIEATADIVCCYKPNIAFYEAYGIAGLEALRKTLSATPAHIPVLLDAKRGDVGNTAESYAAALFDIWGADAVTVNGYLGRDSLDPFLRRADRGVFVVCRTSNPGAVDLQDLPIAEEGRSPRPLYMALAERVRDWNEHGNAGLVVGATYPREMANLRAVCPELPFLVPGVGAQAGALEESVRAAANRTDTGFLISASRAVMYAGAGNEVDVAARRAAVQLRDAINAELERVRVAEAAGR